MRRLMQLRACFERSEEAVVFSFAVGIALSAMSPTPLLRAFDLPNGKEIYPAPAFPLRTGEYAPVPPVLSVGRIRIESNRGCVVVREKDRVVTGPVCNRYLLHPEDVGSRFEVRRLVDGDTYYVEASSECLPSEAFGDCDRAGMTVAADGRRLDDGVFDRVYRRLDLPGRAALVLGVLALLWEWRSGRRGFHRGLVFLGFSSAIAMLWWNR